ncbi:MAG: ABC transporter substrate-binding protein [Chloroflexi bacterium]|nr:ABC transporter substrate-binding protein [Chloroflexota bacterium]
MKSTLNRWYVLVGLLAVASLILTGCGSSKTANVPEFALYAGNAEPVTNWDPAVEFSNGIQVMNNMYEQLVRYDSATGKIIPLLATEYSVSDDGLTWTFKLRQGVKFHDGSGFNAEAVKFSIERTMRLQQGASYIWSAVDTINVVDDYTVEFNLLYPASLDLIASAGYGAFIHCLSIGDDDAWFESGRDCGTGPYKIKSFKPGDEVVVEKFDEYWGGWSEKNIPLVVFKKISEPATRRQMVETGEATVASELPYVDVDTLKNDPKVAVSVSPSQQVLIAMFNTEKAPLDDALVRQALSYAFPYEEVIKNAMGGYATQSYGMVPEGMWGHSTDVMQYSHDLDKAKQLLKDAEHPDGGFKLLLTYTSGDEAQKNASELYKAELGKLGIELEIRSMPWDSQWELAKNPNAADRQDIYMMYWWPDMPSPYSMLFAPFHSEEEPLFNLAYYKNPDFDGMIDEADAASATDRAAAGAMFVDAQNLLMEDAPTIIAFDKQVAWVTTANFKGFTFNPAYPTVVFFYGTWFE